MDKHSVSKFSSIERLPQSLRLHRKDKGSFNLQLSLQIIYNSKPADYKYAGASSHYETLTGILLCQDIAIGMTA
jgi:hypothetical protein